MIRISLIKKNLKKKKLILKYEQKYFILKKKLLLASSFLEKLKFQKKLQELPKNSSKSRLKLRCWRTGRSKGVYKDFGLSKHSLRYLMERGMLPGVIKSTW